jgi:transposase
VTIKKHNFDVGRHQEIKQRKPLKADVVDKLIAMKKIKLNPTTEQKNMFQKWYNGYRYTYNKTIENIINDVGTQSEGVSCNIKVNEDDTVSLELGKCVRPTTKLFINMKEVKQPKIKATIKYYKRTQSCKLKIDVLQDPKDKPLKVKIQEGYPSARHWHQYRDELVTALNNPFFEGKEWLKETPKNIRQCAVHDACAAYKSICTNAKNNGTKGKLREQFAKKKNQSWSFGVEQQAGFVTSCETKKSKKTVPAIQVCPTFLTTKIKCFESIPDDAIKHDFKIHKDKRSRYWLLLPFEKYVVHHPHTSGCALDNGIHKLFTSYSTNGVITEVFPKMVTKEEIDRMDHLQSRLDTDTTLSTKRRTMLKKRWLNAKEKIKNRVNNLHWHVIKELISNHKWIVMGKFYVKSILRSNTITKYSKRMLSFLEHYAFKQRLQYKCLANGVSFHNYSEWGTTIGCPCCGKVNRMTLAEREYNCSHCTYKAERDAKSACCIMLKYAANVW